MPKGYNEVFYDAILRLSRVIYVTFMSLLTTRLEFLPKVGSGKSIVMKERSLKGTFTDFLVPLFLPQTSVKGSCSDIAKAFQDVRGLRRSS